MTDKTKIFGNQHKKASSEISVRVRFSDISATGDIFSWLPRGCAIENLHSISSTATNAGANLTILGGDPSNIAGMTAICTDIPVDHSIDVMVEHVATKKVFHTAGQALVIKNGCNPFTAGEVVLSFKLKEFLRNTGELLYN